MSLVFEPMEPYGQSYAVSTGSQKLGRVSYVLNDGDILVTHMEIEPYLQGFNIEAQILNALLTDDAVKSLSVLSDLSTAAFYQADGFVCHSKQILLTKTNS